MIRITNICQHLRESHVWNIVFTSGPVILALAEVPKYVQQKSGHGNEAEMKTSIGDSLFIEMKVCK